MTLIIFSQLEIEGTDLDPTTSKEWGWPEPQFLALLSAADRVNFENMGVLAQQNATTAATVHNLSVRLDLTAKSMAAQANTIFGILANQNQLLEV